MAHHKKTGGVVIPKCEKPSMYRKKIFRFFFIYCLSYFTDHLQHLYKTLSSTLDVYLDELQLELIKKHGVGVGTSTIWRTLVKGGYTMKKVCKIDQLHMSDTERSFSSLIQQLNGA